MQLAQLIVSQTSIVDENIRSNGLPQPSFEPDKDKESSEHPKGEAIPSVVEKAKNDVVEATIELRQLLEGPVELLLPEASLFKLLAYRRFLCEYPPSAPFKQNFTFGRKGQDVY